MANLEYGSNPYQDNPNPYVSTKEDWKKYADNNGATLLGMQVHYIDCREGTAKCLSAKIVKVISGWEQYATTIVVNLNYTGLNGVKTAVLNLPLSGRTGPVCPNWHFPSHDPNLVPKVTPAPPYPPGTILEDNRGSYDPTQPPNPTYTGSYVIQDSSINNGHCTYMAFQNGVQVANFELSSCDEDTVPYNEQYLGTDSGNGVTTKPDSNLLGIDDSITKTSPFKFTNYSLGHDVFWFGGTAARGVEGIISPLSVSLSGTSCTDPMSPSAQIVMQEVKVIFNAGNFLSFGLVNACNGIKYYVMLKTIGNNISIVGTVPVTNPGNSHTLRIEQMPDTSLVQNIQTGFEHSPPHYAAMINPDWDSAAMGCYRAADGWFYFTQLYTKTTGCTIDLYPPPNNPAPLFQWDRDTFSSIAEKQLHRLSNIKRTSQGLTTIDMRPDLVEEARYRSKTWASYCNDANGHFPDRQYEHGIHPNEICPDGEYKNSHDLWLSAKGYPLPKGWHLVADEMIAKTICFRLEQENQANWTIDTDLPFNRWEYILDGVVVGSTSCPEGTVGAATVSAGLETHVPTTTVIPKHTYSSLKYKDNAGVWQPWYGHDATTISANNCGRFSNDTTWIAGQNVSCA